MGDSFGSIQVFRQSPQVVRDVLEDLSAKKKGRFWVGPTLGSWIGVYPLLRNLGHGVASDLARRLGGEIFSFIVHDDVFTYDYYRDGKRADRYCSRPDGWASPVEAAREAFRGRPRAFAHLAADSQSFAQFESRLSEQAVRQDVFATVLLNTLSSALGMANVQTSYEDLSDGEGGVAGWAEFFHIPDLRSERARFRKADAAHQDEVRRLIHEGLMLAERGGHRGRHVPFLRCCPAADGAGFLLAATPPEFSTREPIPLEWIGPPWSAGTRPTGMTIDPSAQALVSSPSTRLMAAWSANSDPVASFWDLSSRLCVAGLRRKSRAVRHVAFMPDESAIVCSCSGLSSGHLAIVPMGPGDPLIIDWSLNVKSTAVHPRSRALAVVDERNRLTVFDLPSGRARSPLFVGGVRVPLGSMLFLEHDYPRDWPSMPFDELLGLRRDEGAGDQGRPEEVPKNGVADSSGRKSRSRSSEWTREMFERETRDALEETRTPGWLEKKASSREWVHQLAFDPTGERLFAATSGGLRVYSWRECLEADSEMPPPIMAVDADATASTTDEGFINIGAGVLGFVHDEDRGWLLFGGTDGRVRYLDLAVGETGTLCDLPGLWQVNSYALSRDRTTLAVNCGADLIEDSSARPMRRSAAVQFWDYRALCGRTGWSPSGSRGST